MNPSIVPSVSFLSQSGIRSLSATSHNQSRSVLCSMLTSLPVRFGMLVALTIILSQIGGGDSASGAKHTISGINQKPISARVSNREKAPRGTAKEK